jgi:hypothetical protein
VKSIELVMTARDSAKFCSSDLHGTRQVPWSGLSDSADIDLSLTGNFLFLLPCLGCTTNQSCIPS